MCNNANVTYTNLYHLFTFFESFSAFVYGNLVILRIIFMDLIKNLSLDVLKLVGLGGGGQCNVPLP